MDKYQQRSSSYDSYYMMAQNHTNLDVIPYGLVQEILTTRNGSDIRATGVYLTSQSTGQVLVVQAKKEVIVSGGAFQTPQLLMLSGIGPADELAKNGIPLVLDVPNVGKNMQDHNYFSINVRANASTSIDSLMSNLNDLSALEDAAQEYIQNQTGIMTTPGGTTYGFQQVPVADLQAMDAVELENRTQQAHIEYLFEPTYYPSQPSPNGYQYGPWSNETFISITAGMIAPASRGTVTLQSRLITDQPVINVNYFHATTDQKMGVYAFKNLRRILAHPSMAAWTIGPDNGEVVPGAAVQTDEEILNHIQNTAIPIWHASGTCAMLPQEQGGVVDSNLKVYGVQGLRVVDASVMPIVPDQHTMGAVYMLAEKAADLIKEEYGLPMGVHAGAHEKRGVRGWD
jgi:choline dehydrogenase